MQLAEQKLDHLGLLNPAQRLAAEYGERCNDDGFRAGPLLVIAGAGTGKTMTLAHRVAHLVIEGVSPERILLLTFLGDRNEILAKTIRDECFSLQKEDRCEEVVVVVLGLAHCNGVKRVLCKM